MKIVHNIDLIGRASYGLGTVCEALAVNQKRLGHNVEIWATESASTANQIDPLLRESIRYFHSIIPHFYLSTDQILAAKQQDSIEIMHQHGVWTAKSLTTLEAAKRGATTVISPHGSFQNWALKKSKLKKAVARLLYENKNFDSANGFHAVSESEAQEIRNLGVDSPIAVIPNGISTNWINDPATGTSFRRKFDIPSNVRILLYLSRITPKKGIPLMLEALKNINIDRDSWQIIIAGVTNSIIWKS
ncbi:hypothetical protein DKM44_11260 [Deinococcus irradiatisoli]|uniref:Uncharacterized protein n=1 Tax=Deinococcus irradiatisoli TaxID=2202254 RepID=A0A2Z3JIA9_9DEIO|nr:glycosyltransferase [Deinococcus irradiatisoli]AWN23736.1 hypothetical protein DKM44_11260 [Deinococcus irradiatisoli]